jgi:3-(methylthio)propionyl---CoA ligase
LREQFRSYVLPTALAVEGCPLDPAQDASAAGAKPLAVRE